MQASAAWMPPHWYAPATTRREHVPVGSLMSSLTSNGRIGGVPTLRRQLPSRCKKKPSAARKLVGGLGRRVGPTVGLRGCNPRAYRDVLAACRHGPAPQYGLTRLRTRRGGYRSDSGYQAPALSRAPHIAPETDHAARA